MMYHDIMQHAAENIGRTTSFKLCKSALEGEQVCDLVDSRSIWLVTKLTDQGDESHQELNWFEIRISRCPQAYYKFYFSKSSIKTVYELVGLVPLRLPICALLSVNGKAGEDVMWHDWVSISRNCQ